MKLALSLGLAAMATLAAQEFTRGLGVYPGDPKEYTGPSLELDRNTYRNLALHRPAYQSSSYDYNLTAQLVTDGIKHTRLPRWVSVETSQQGVLPKNQREWVLDGNWVSDVSLKGHHGWIVIEIGGDDRAQVDRVEVDARLQARGEPENWVCTVAGSDDGSAWKDLGHAAGMARPTGELRTSIALAGISRSRYYRISLDNARATNWQVGEIAFFHGGQRQAVGGPAHFTSAWMAAGKGEEWVYVDLGAVCTFDRIALAWIRRPAEGSIQVSDDAAAWKLVQPLSGTDEVKLTHPAQGRYVRVLMTKPATPDGYVLSELEVYGRGGPVAKNTGWKLQRDS